LAGLADSNPADAAADAVYCNLATAAILLSSQLSDLCAANAIGGFLLWEQPQRSKQAALVHSSSRPPKAKVHQSQPTGGIPGQSSAPRRR
jgi:hypothetical protein